MNYFDMHFTLSFIWLKVYANGFWIGNLWFGRNIGISFLWIVLMCDIQPKEKIIANYMTAYLQFPSFPGQLVLRMLKLFKNVLQNIREIQRAARDMSNWQNVQLDIGHATWTCGCYFQMENRKRLIFSVICHEWKLHELFHINKFSHTIKQVSWFIFS